MNKFERYKNPLDVLSIGIPTYNIYRMQIYNTAVDPGFYILTPEQTKETLAKLSKGELSRPNYIIEFSRQYPEFEDKDQMMLYYMRSCFLKYKGKKYYIKSHIV